MAQPNLDVLSRFGRRIFGVVSVSQSIEMNGLGALDMTARPYAARGHLLEAYDDPGSLDIGDVVRLRMDDDTPTGYRLVTQRRDRQFTTGDEEKVNQWTGEHLVSYLLTRTGLGAGFDLVPGDNKIRFEGLNPHQLFTLILATVAPRGAMYGVLLDSTATHDSNGVAWEADSTIDYWTMSQSDYVVDVLDMGVETRKFDWQPRGPNLLSLFNPNSGNRLDETNPPLLLDSATHTSEALQNRSLVDARTVCIVNGAPGHSVVVDLHDDYPGYNEDIPRTECTLEYAEVTDPDILELAGTLEVRRRMGGFAGNGVLNQMNLSLPLNRSSGTIKVPGTDFGCGDWIGVRAGGEVADPWRVMQYVIERGERPYDVSAEIALGMRLDGDKQRLWRMMSRLERQLRAQREV